MGPPLNRWIRSAIWACLLCGAPLGAQERPGSVVGVVFDSVASRPLAGAAVSVLGTDRIGVTAEDGSFRIAGVPPGEHRLAFAHARLDSLGLGPIATLVSIGPGEEVSTSLTIPSAPSLRRAVCGREVGETGVLIGLVRDGQTGALLADARISAAWRTDGRLGMSLAETDVAGRYTLCDLPRDRRITLWVSRGDQRSGNEHVSLGSRLMERKDLEIELDRVVRVMGLVVDAATGSPLRDARVLIEGRAAITGSDGRFVLQEMETGRQSLEVDLLGYRPVHDTLEVVEGTQEMVVRMSPDPIELDPITVTVLSRNLEAQGFYERMRLQSGIFLTRQEIAIRDPAYTTDLLRGAPGVTVQPARNRPGYDLVLRGGCRPTYYLNGIPQLPGTFHLNNLGPEDIEALEVYSGTARVPPRFQRDSRATDRRGVTTSCSGAVVVWLR